MENSRIYREVYDPIPYLIIENTFKEEELELIWEEFEFLNQPGKMYSAEGTGSAESPDGKILKNNKSVFLDELFEYNKKFSNILKINNSIVSPEVKTAFSKLNFGYNAIWQTNVHSTLLNYYHDGDYYDTHSDSSLYTSLTFFYKEPKQFTGGDFWLSRFKHKIEIKNNMTVIIPSFVEHHVDEVNMKNSVYGNGRYSMTIFLYTNPSIQNGFWKDEYWKG